MTVRLQAVTMFLGLLNLKAHLLVFLGFGIDLTKPFKPTKEESNEKSDI